MAGSIRILHVDDDPDFAALTADILPGENEQFTVETVTSPVRALDMLADCEYDCLISDYDMPELNGIELLERIREDDPHLPVILFTGKGTEEVASQAISAGVTDYLQKDGGRGQFTVLANRVRNAVEQKEHERQFETLVDNLPGFVYRMRHARDGWLVDFVGGEVENLTGYADDQLVTGDVSFADDIVHPEDRDRVWEAVEEALEGDGSFELTYRIVTSDGTTRWVWEHGEQVAVSSEGEPVLEGFVSDITDRKRTERQLRETRERYHRILEHSSDYVIIVDEWGAVSYTSSAVEHVLGHNPDDVVGTNAFEFVHPDDQDIAQAAFANLLEQPDAEVVVEYRARDADGGYRWIEARGGNYFDDPIIDGVLVNVREITERKAREQTLTALHAAAREIGQADDQATVYETLIETAEQVLDFNLVVVDVEQDGYLVQEAWGLDVDDRKYWERTSLEEDDSFAVRAYNRQETILIADLRETEIAPADPEYRSALTVPIGEFGTFQAVFSEVGAFSERDREFAELLVDHARVKLSQLEDKQVLREQTAELERKNERLDEFASFVSHDLRNPLNVATLRLDLMREEYDGEHLTDVEHALDRMDVLIEDVLTLARQGETVGETEPVRLSELVTQCWQNVETTGATIDCRTARSVRADQSRLSGVLENMFQNAIEHGGDDVTITVGDLPDGFYVEDDGDGIPESERGKVFESGYSTKTDGTGFGLVIIREVVEAHGWEIDVTGGERGGARFEITGVEKP